MTEIRQIPLRFIRTDGKTQVRVAMDQGAVTEYAEAMKEGIQFPPVILFQDADVYWLGDGFHRVEAAVFAGKKNIKADVRKGGLREAQFFAIGANHSHGLRRTNADKRKAVELLLSDPQWGAWSVREIAKVAGVSHFLVESMKAEKVAFNATPDEEKPASAATLKTDHGTEIGVVHGAGNPAVEAAAQAYIDQQQAAPKPSPDKPKPAPELDEDPAPVKAEPLALEGTTESARIVQLERLLAEQYDLAKTLRVEITNLKVDKTSLESQVAELTRKLEESGYQVQEIHEENQSLHRVLDAEDLLSEFKKEVTRNQDRARVSEARAKSLAAQLRDVTHMAKSWKRKFEATQKTKKDQATPEEVEP